MKLLKLFSLLLFFAAMNLSCSKPVNDCIGPNGNYVSTHNGAQTSLWEKQKELEFKEVLSNKIANPVIEVKKDTTLAYMNTDLD